MRKEMMKTTGVRIKLIAETAAFAIFVMILFMISKF